MIIRELDIKSSEYEFEKFKNNNYQICSNLDDDYLNLRNEILDLWNSNAFEKSYKFDYQFAVQLYNLLSSKAYFTEIVETNIDFWRYLSVCVIPDLIYKRFNSSKDVESHIYKRNVRIYPYTLYTFIKLTWQGSLQETLDVLSSKNFSTDTILQYVERPGKTGISLDFFRTLIKEYASLNLDNSALLLRSILRINTAKYLVFIPEFYEGGIEGYTKELISIALKGEEK